MWQALRAWPGEYGHLPPSFRLTGHCGLSWALPCLLDVASSARLWLPTPGAAGLTNENAQACCVTKYSVEERKASLHSGSQEAEERRNWAALSPSSLKFFTPHPFPMSLPNALSSSNVEMISKAILLARRCVQRVPWCKGTCFVF